MVPHNTRTHMKHVNLVPVQVIKTKVDYYKHIHPYSHFSNSLAFTYPLTLTRDAWAPLPGM